jgi:hypothetical protein
VAKCPADRSTVDLFGGFVGPVVRVMPLDVRRRDVATVAVEVVDELCAWCGVDRAGGCGACSDLRYLTR